MELKIQDLKKSFVNSGKEEFKIIDIKEFELDPGEQIAIKGESGSGKSTFLNLLSGIIRADSGQIFINGTDIAGLSEAKTDRFRAANIGYIFQTFNLLQGYTALENVMIGMMFAGKPDKITAENALSTVGLSGKMNNRPNELSVGEQQRVSVARAIVNSPVLLLADEPTANLDSKNSGLIIDLIREICSDKKISLITVTHDPMLLDHFDTVINFSEINISG
ncbi:MAG TPA: ABC transporter ATP-binding protein [Ignavibacteria bacterium]|nr:ABC transporter ATP-binding protein [Ignavibacteria bacterium]HMR41867.1 ABC transporter ATP-binding protein [Ignavibacteria bacterium]